MSLLMDALKRAELAKQQGRGIQASGPAETGATPEPGTQLPNLPKLEDLDEEFIAHANDPVDQPSAAEPARSSPMPGRSGVASARPPTAAGDAAADREVVRNAFAAKAGIGGERRGVVIAAGLGLLAIGIAGGYVWLQLKPQAAPAAAARPAAGLPVVRSAPTPLPAPEILAQTARSDPPPRDAEPLPRVSPPRQIDPLPPIKRRTENSPTARQAPVLPGAENAIRVTSSQPGIDPAIDEGYRLLLAGDLAGSRIAYGKALRGEPRNADALHGIAAIALREGRTEEAAIAFQKILESNPADSAAQAGLIGLNGQGDAIAGESRIKSLIAAQGELPILNFALGNLYARQQRWNDAQQAYFKAVTGDAGNPDFLFNLAVSLDQLHQPKLAAQYYGQALTATAGHTAAFDRKLAEQRLRELRP